MVHAQLGWWDWLWFLHMTAEGAGGSIGRPGLEDGSAWSSCLWTMVAPRAMGSAWSSCLWTMVSVDYGGRLNPRAMSALGCVDAGMRRCVDAGGGPGFGMRRCWGRTGPTVGCVDAGGGPGFGLVYGMTLARVF